ncbi:MAG: hypothetical protein ACREAA_13670 [Candidatus Polarisedimenticolia bacterium]
MDPRDWATAVTAAVAVYGAGLATYTAVTTRRATERLLKVGLTLNVLGDRPEPRTVMMLCAASAGQRKVKIQSACIRFPHGRQFIPLEPSLADFLPWEIGEAETLDIPVPIEHVVQALQQVGYEGRVALRAEFRDILDVRYVSRPLRGNVATWARLASREAAAK